MKENNKWKYQGDSRYEKVWATMQLLSIQDVTTDRQHKNGTIAWRLPIKNNWPRKSASFIEVASFSTGYVRNQNSGYTNYQINKRCDNEPQYFKLPNGDYRKFKTKGCVLIPIEIDRLEYMMKYVVKNYFIKNANQVPNGEFYPKWQYEKAIDNTVFQENRADNLRKNYEDKLNLAKQNVEFHEQRADEYRNNINDVTVIIDGHKYKLI